MKKKLNYEKEQKKLKLKNALKWVLCGLGWTALGVAFFGLLGLQIKSCANKKSKAAEEVTTTITTPVNLYQGVNNSVSGTITGQLAFHYVGFEGVSYDDLDYELHGDDYFSGWSLVYISDTGYQHYGRFELVYGDNQGEIYLRFYRGPASFSEINKVLVAEYFITSDGYDGTGLQHGIYNQFNDFVYTTNFKLFTEWETAYDEYTYDENYLWWGLLLGQNSLVVGEGQSFDFNNQINRYAPLGQTNDIAIALGSSYLGGANFIKATIFNGLFTDAGGTWYKSIRIHYADGTGMRYIDSRGQDVVHTLNGTLFLSLSYITIDGVEVIVNLPRWVNVNDNVCYTNQSYWVTEAYNNLSIYAVDSVSNPYNLPGLQGRTGLDILNSFNESNGTGTIPGGSIGGNASDIFTLISLAFTSMVSILSMQVVGGVTLGTLVFLPFVITIIVFVVWLFKR